jgi:hypothetical protein
MIAMPTIYMNREMMEQAFDRFSTVKYAILHPGIISQPVLLEACPPVGTTDLFENRNA